MKTYRESQKLNIWWAWLPIIPVFFFLLYTIWQQVINGIPVGDNPIPNAPLIGIAALVLGLIITMAVTELKTEITKEGVSARFLPFGKVKYFWSEVDYFTLEKPNLSGVGVKYNPLTKMKYFNTHIGDMLILHLKNGKKFGVGTKKPEEMDAFLDEIFSGNDTSDLLQNIKENREKIELKQEERDDPNYV